MKRSSASTAAVLPEPLGPVSATGLPGASSTPHRRLQERLPAGRRPRTRRDRAEHGPGLADWAADRPGRPRQRPSGHRRPGRHRVGQRADVREPPQRLAGSPAVGSAASGSPCTSAATPKARKASAPSSGRRRSARPATPCRPPRPPRPMRRPRRAPPRPGQARRRGDGPGAGAEFPLAVRDLGGRPLVSAERGQLFGAGKRLQRPLGHSPRAAGSAAAARPASRAAAATPAAPSRPAARSTTPACGSRTAAVAVAVSPGNRGDHDRDRRPDHEVLYLVGVGDEPGQQVALLPPGSPAGTRRSSRR